MIGIRLGSMDSTQDKNVKQIRVISFEFCGDKDCKFKLCHNKDREFQNDQDCEFSNGEDCEALELSHSKIVERLVPLEQGQATALSYTWGEFERRPVAIGHDEAGNAVSMELGLEWTQPEFSTKLAGLGYSRTPDGENPLPLWIDQLSIPQDDEAELRKTLASIPSIYSILDVVALLPGSPCRCLQEGIDTYGGLEDGSSNELKTSGQMAAWAMHMKSCLNSTSFCSYFERLWTRQEMTYASKIQAEWTHETESPCVKPASWSSVPLELMARLTTMAPYKDDSSAPPNEYGKPATHIHLDLAPFARAFIQVQSRSVDSTNALLRTVARQEEFWAAALSAMQDFLVEDDVGIVVNTYRAVSTLCGFLAGQELEKHNQSINLVRQLHVFMKRLSELGESRRAATQLRDYVAAVWIDCPQYTLPHSFKSMGLDALLQNAVLQFEQNFGMSIPVTAIAGLFGAEAATSLWRPTCYLQPERIQHVGHVYSVVCPKEPVEVSETFAVPLLLHSPQLGRSRNLVDLMEYMRGQKPDDVVQDMREIIARWPVDIVKRSARMSIPSSPDHMLESRLKWRSALIQGTPIMQTVISERTGHNPLMRRILSSLDVNSFPEPQLLYEAIYELVAQALGLDYETCSARKDLYIALCLTQGPSIGLLSRNQLPTMHSPPSLTICRDVWPTSSACTVLEARRMGNSLYACGIWVPQTTTSITEIGGLVAESGPNAVIV